MSTALFALRAFQIGLNMNDMDELSRGDVMDIIIESANDSYKYPQMANQGDIDKFFK